MAEEESIPALSDQDGTDTSQSKDTYVPEEPTQDVSISLLDIQMPETPESTKGQVSDGDTSRLESPKMVKPVLGKVQAKKRLMAFANKFKVLFKPQVKSNLSQHSTGALKMKDKGAQDDTSTNKSKKKTEEKILAIEEIRREESKSKLLLAEAMAAASMEEEHHGKNISGLLENPKHIKERSKHEGTSDSRKGRSAMERKYSERHRHRDKTDRDSANQETKDRSGSVERSTRKSQEREKHKKDKKRKDDRDKRDNSRTDSSRDKRDEGKDRKDSEKERREEAREKRDGTKGKKENTKDKRHDAFEGEAESKDKKDKDKDRWREKELMKCNSWVELRKSGLTLDDIVQLRKRDNSERSVKNRTAQDFARHFEQMLMLNNYRVKRQAVIAEGLDGPRKYPPESIKTTRRAKGSQIMYCENPNVSLLLRAPQLLEVVTPERRERIRDICEASSSRIDVEEAEDTVQQKRKWYQQINSPEYHKDAKWQVPVQLPKSKWDSEDEEASSTSVIKEEIEKAANKLQLNQQEGCSTSSSVTDEDKTTDNDVEEVKGNRESSEKAIDNATTSDKVSSASPTLQIAGDEKLASEYEQFMKMVCTDIPTGTDATKEYSPKKNAVKSASPHTYHEFDIESNSVEDNADIEMTLKKFEKPEKPQKKGSTKSPEEESTASTDIQVQIDENDVHVEHAGNNDQSEDSKSIPSDWENVRIKVERLSDENTESREVKKKKKRKKVTSSSDSSSSTSSSESEREKKKKRKKILSNSSSSDSDSTDSSSSSSSDSSSSDEKRKRKRKKKKADKKRKKARRAARTKKKRRRKMSTDSSSSDSDERRKKKRKMKKKKDAKQFDIKSINNGDMSTVISGSPVISSPSDGTKILHSTTPTKKIKEEATAEEKTRADQAASTRRSVAGLNVHGTECRKQKAGRKENKSEEGFVEEWEMDSIVPSQQNGDDTSSQDHTELGKIDALEKDKHRKKRKHSRDNGEQEKDRSSKVNEARVHRGKERSDEEPETKKKKRKEKDVRSSTEFLADWERESERITQQIMQSEVKFSKKLGKQKKETWGETDFDTLNVPSLTQLEKEVCQKQLLADEWEVDSLEALSDLNLNKRRSTSKKAGKEVRYDKKTDTYIAIEKEESRETKKKQERLCAIRIWEEEQEEGEREEMMLLQQKKRKKDDWDIEEESYLRKRNEEIGIHMANNIVVVEKDWSKLSESTNAKEDSNKLPIKLEPLASKRVKKSRWDMGSQSEEKPDTKDIWEEEYAEWSTNKGEQKLGKTEKTEPHAVEHSESSAKPDLIEFHQKKSQNREPLELWTSEEMTTKSLQAKKIEDVSITNLISTETDKEQTVSTKVDLQNSNQFKDILGLNEKFKEKTIELYSPSSPALSQKSQDAETSNDSNPNSLPREKRRKETSVATEELSIPMDGIPLQLMKLRDTKYATNEKVEKDQVQLENESSVHKFDIKHSDNLFDDLPPSELCSEKHNSKAMCMDIFAEYESEESRSKRATTSSNTSSETHAKDDEGKTVLKFIPKQFLIRRTNEQAKAKRVLEAPLQDPEQHAAALLSIQKKLLESHALKDNIKQSSSGEEPVDQFKSRFSAPSNSETDKLLDTTEFAVASKSSVIAEQRSKSPASEKMAPAQSEQSESYKKESKNDDAKRYKSGRNLSDTNASSSARSPTREQRRRSPNRKESEKRYSHDYGKDKKDRRSDDADKSDRRDSRSSKTDFADSRRKSSPSSGRGRKKRSGSPYGSWNERQRSGSRSPGHSWSRSRSRSPKRKDEANTRSRDKKRERYDDERSGRSRTDERRDKYARSPRFGYNEDNFKKHGSVSSKGNRDDWGRRRHDSIDRDREQDVRSYDSIDVLRDRPMESEGYRDSRFHAEGEAGRPFWEYEGSNILRDGNESIDSYAVGQDLPVEYDDRAYYREGSLERLQSSPQHSSRYRRNQRGSAKRERQWEKDKDTSDLDRHGHLAHRSRNRTPPRSRHSPARQSERFRRKSRSRSWSRSSSRSRSTSRSRLRMRSRSRSNSRSPSNRRSRARSTSLSRLRSPEHGLRLSELRSSRSPSPGRGRLNEVGRERKDEDENRKLNVCSERGRRIETIVQSGANILDSEMGINSMDAVANFQYSNEIEGANEYYYTENNLTYPPCIDDSSASSPKRLSLDDRLEIELGIKKQHSKDSSSSEYSSNFNPNVVVYPSPPPQQHQMMYRQQPTVLQVGNVLQVVPADFNGVQSARREAPTAATPSARPGSSQVVRVGNVLQVVPTSLDWSADQSSSTADQSSRALYPSSAVPAPSPVSSTSMSVPVPVPVPVPPAVSTVNNLAPVATMSPVASLPLSLPVPVPVPVPISAAATAFARSEVQPQKIVQPVYNYEAILETRRKEREERKKVRELRRKEKERRRIERTNRRALRQLEKKSMLARQAGGASLDHRKGSTVDPSVLKALREGEEQGDIEFQSTNPVKEEEETVASMKEDDEDAAADEDEDEDEDEAEVEAEAEGEIEAEAGAEADAEIEAEAEDDDEEEEDEDEDDDDDDEKPLQVINQQTEEITDETVASDANKSPAEIETKKEWPKLPPPPLKGILIAPGFRRDAVSNGDLDTLSDADDDKIGSDKDEEAEKNNECDRDSELDAKPGKSRLARSMSKTRRSKKSVQFADGIKPGEGTSPSGGEGDMPSPPPPTGISFREGLKDLRRDKIYSSRKSRKQEKRARPPKAKKKVKVKIIKLKKPRVTPLTAMMMDDSDEMDDRSPPPPPPGSPPSPHLWPSYLSAYNTAVRAVEQPPQTTTSTLTSVPQAPPPPTPLPLLVPPPPLNYTIQPCSKA